MTGPEHYRKAEELARQLETGRQTNNLKMTTDQTIRLAAAAEIHARLAQVAATVDAGIDEMDRRTAQTWDKALGVTPR